MNLAALAFVYRKRLAGLRVEYATLAGYKVLNILDVGLEEALILGVDLEVVRDHAWEGLHDGSDELGAVDGGPRVGLASNSCTDNANIGLEVSVELGELGDVVVGYFVGPYGVSLAAGVHRMLRVLHRDGSHGGS